jgi:hypothetical protein
MVKLVYIGMVIALARYLPEFLPARYSSNGTMSPLPLCIVMLCLVALYFLVKCSEQVAHTCVSLPIFNTHT